jgi:glycerol-1-phosphate dehydrogenase [NAD(P)+]
LSLTAHSIRGRKGDVESLQVFVVEPDAGTDESARSLAGALQSLGVGSPFVVASQHGRELAARLTGDVANVPNGADQRWAAHLGSRAHRAGADAVVAIGGGRCLDVAKLAAARAGLSIVTVPTQLSHDGICSPVAVVPNEDGRAESVGALAPRAVFLSLPTIATAPLSSIRAGIGDLLANPLALRDWALAVERGLENADQQAWDMSVESFERIESYLDGDVAASGGDPEFLRRLADALILSGMAMVEAGTSRPASGGEHEVSHAIDELYGGRALHGAQVAFGCMISVALYGEDTAAFAGRLKRLGLPTRPEDLGLSALDVVRVLCAAPDTRPGRYTILEAADLDESSATELVRRIWPDV